MSGPYGPQNVKELLDLTVEQKGFMSHEDVKDWVPYFENYINRIVVEELEAIIKSRLHNSSYTLSKRLREIKEKL